jgi:DNA polymerase IV
LSIAHVDCDAFYATVEKRERPELADRPVIVGGGARGVVLACCYVSRLYGVRSAMPMFKALAACPAAVVIRPDMAKYREVGRAVRAELRRLTPLVEPVSIDEAFLDLSGTEKLYGAVPAQLLATLAQKVETTLKITLSIGLSDSKFLAKIASASTSRAALRSSAAAMLRRFSPTSRYHCCGGSAPRCSAGSPPMALP